MFLCNNATCGHFYHPKCVAQQLHPINIDEASELEKKITEGFSFTCPIHWCFHCKGLEDRTQEPLQFAVCRRCPKSYHRKCLPRFCFRTSYFSCFFKYFKCIISYSSNIWNYFTAKFPLTKMKRTISSYGLGNYQKEF